MNTSPSNELLSQMERATAVGPIDGTLSNADSLLDPETAPLRAGWQGLSDLLEAAQPRREIRVAEPVLGKLEPASDRHRWRNAMMLAGSLAAALLLTVSGFYLPRVPHDATPIRQTQAAELTRRGVDTGKLVLGNEQDASDHHAIEVVVTRDSLDWQDDLDDQLLDAWGQVYRLQTAATTLDARHASVVDSMQKLQQDLDGDNTL